LAPTNPLLIGKWRAESSDRSSRERYGDTTLEFRPDGKLVYTENVGNEKEVSLLTYRVEDRFIVTDQPSAPREDRTAFELTNDGKLVLDYGGFRSCYVRG
jgi:hypothetical protein